MSANMIPATIPALAYTFQNPALLEQALTHCSVEAKPHYERLEFLGDRVLGLVVSEILFLKFPQATEGELAKRHAALVRAETLTKIAEIWGISHYVQLAPGEESSGGRQRASILADVVEALLAAIYLDSQSLTPIRALVQRDWEPLIDHLAIQDAKSKLQELLQSNGHKLPDYTVTHTTGPEHVREFTVQVTCTWGAATGVGQSKQVASQAAAQALLTQLGHTHGG